MTRGHVLGAVLSVAWCAAGCVNPHQPIDPDSGSAASAPLPDVRPQGWLSYQAGPDGLIQTPWSDVSLRSRPLIYPQLSAGGRRLAHWVFGREGHTTLVLGGMHGGERTPAMLSFRFLRWLEQNPSAVAGGRIVVAPLIDPDGLVSGVRGNANHVDLNRNYPAKNWRPAVGRNPNWHGSRPASETETQFVLSLIEAYRPACIVSIHAPEACVNYDGPARQVAQVMSDACGLPVRASIGYPTPGSFGSYAGLDLGIPTVTFELRSKQRLIVSFEACRDALLAAHAYSLEHPRQ